MWKYIGVQIGYALSGKCNAASTVLYYNIVCSLRYCSSPHFLAAWAIYTLITFVIGVAIALLYICLVLFTDWVISVALTLM